MSAEISSIKNSRYAGSVTDTYREALEPWWDASLCLLISSTPSRNLHKTLLNGAEQWHSSRTVALHMADLGLTLVQSPSIPNGSPRQGKFLKNKQILPYELIHKASQILKVLDTPIILILTSQ